ncbi:MAG: DUF3078 domain-containing protein [Cyclobacteriaceae bacterium]|nr:DUF3078 domain-containing protein [Cyclobacteriaceae bacterium]
MKYLLTYSVILLFSIQTFPNIHFVNSENDSTWDTKGVLTLNLQQVGYSNWAQGGESALSYGAVFNFTANKTTEKYLWKNNIRVGYGLIKRNGFSPRKNNDLIILVSDYGRNINKNWQYSAAVDFRNQFTAGYTYTEDPITGIEIKTLVSDIFAPGYLQSSLGITFKKSDIFSATLSPVSNKITFVLNESLSAQGKFGVTPGDKIRTQLGSSLNISYNQIIMENVTVKSNMLLFGDYNNLNVWDVNYELFVDFKVNKFITTNFLLQAIYDDDIKGNNENLNISGPALQIRHVLNLGITFNLI